MENALSSIDFVSDLASVPLGACAPDPPLPHDITVKNAATAVAIITLLLKFTVDFILLKIYL
jgi:hypothetical protein